MTLAELLADAVHRLERAGIPYMVTGSVASTYYGEPRATLDLDLVIDPVPEALDALIAGFASDGTYYVDHDAAFIALRERSQFNVVGPHASKIDLIFRKDRPFSRQEFERRRQADLLGTPAFIASVEDMIIAKLEWSRSSGSERQLRDVAAMLDVTGDTIDRPYIHRWVRALELDASWRRVETDRNHDSN